MNTTVVMSSKTTEAKTGFVAQRVFNTQRVLVVNPKQYANAMQKVSKTIAKMAAPKPTK